MSNINPLLRTLHTFSSRLLCIGLYRLQEHVLKNVPELVQCKKEVGMATKGLHGGCHDVEYAISEIESLQKIKTFEALNDHIVRAIESVLQNSTHQIKCFGGHILASMNRSCDSLSLNNLSNFLSPLFIFCHIPSLSCLDKFSLHLAHFFLAFGSCAQCPRALSTLLLFK